MEPDPSEGAADADEQRFLRLFSQQLAEALRAKDEEEAAERERLRAGGRRSSRPADDGREWERIRRAYAELCHDDPIVAGGDGDCRLLARALTPKFKSSSKSSGREADAKKLGLSPRLVQGILQATSRAGTNASMQPPSAQTNEDDDAAQESLFGPGITTAGGYAELAFAIFVEGPYRCIQQADNLQVASKFLGSFQPPDTTHATKEKLSAEEKSRLVDEATANIVEGMETMGAKGDEEKQGTAASKAAADAPDDASSSSSEFFYRNASQSAQPVLDDDNDSMKEVFAEESDPDDYDYGSSYDYPDAGEGADNTNSFVHDEVEDFVFDPMELSEPTATNQSWGGSRKAIHHLLSGASYGKLALGSLSSRAWSDGGMSETLADLAFILLLEVAKKERGSAGQQNSLFHSTLEDDRSDDVEDIGSLWDRPLIILRDRALDKSRGHDALPAYLQLLTAFMAHADAEQDVMSLLTSPHGTSSATAENVLPPVTTVGLSSLASICSSKEMTSSAAGQMCGTKTLSVCPRDEMKKAILSSIEPLARIVECVRPRKSGVIATDAQNSAWARTAACLIPIIEYLTNLQGRFDFQPLFEGGASHNSGLSDAEAKEISDSGFFRELLSMYTATRAFDGTSDAVNALRIQLSRTIFTLAALSPELLGRYAVRVPDFAKEVHASEFIEKNVVDGILWTSMGSSLLESKSEVSKPRLKLRANSKLRAKAPMETKSLAELSIAGLETMIDSSKKALECLKQCVKDAEERTLSEQERVTYNGCKAALGDIKRFSNCLSNCPSATKMWLDSLNNHHDSTQKALAGISELKSLLAKLPYLSEKAKVPQRGHKKDDDDDSTESTEDDLAETGRKAQTLNQLRKDYGVVVASTRASVKVIALALETRKGNGLPLRGPGPCDVSSKTD